MPMKITRGGSATYAIDGPVKQRQCFIRLFCWTDGTAEGFLAWWTINAKTFETCQQSPACSRQLPILQTQDAIQSCPPPPNWNYVIKNIRITETDNNRGLSQNVHPCVLLQINVGIKNIYQSKKSQKKAIAQNNSLLKCRPRRADDKRKIICATASTGIKFTGGTIRWYFFKILMTPHCRVQLLGPARCWRRIGYLHTK